ncbi:MAG: chorismate mutase [Pirellulaceae bacterium]|nr:chorismate mutase [Pirellulaceae bacterium]
MFCRGIRGATTVEENSSQAILEATRQMLALIIRLNEIKPEEVACAYFTVTKDIDAQFPALAARQLGWNNVPFLCGYEIAVPDSLEKCIRVLIQWNTPKSQKEITHVYLNNAVRLRPDLCDIPPVDWEDLNHWIENQMEEMS